jgi:glycosyltransferase involved in cell wall biosynthesis
MSKYYQKGCSVSERTTPTVVWVLDALYRNGAVHLTVQLARRFAPKGCLALVQRLDPNDEVKVTAEERIESLSPRGRRLRSAIVPATARLAALARQADVVVNASEIGVGLVLSWVATQLARKPLVIAVHADLDAAVKEWMPARMHPLFYWIHRHVAGAICVSPDLITPLIRNGLPPERIRVVRNGIDIEAVQATAQAPVDFNDPGVPIVIATGRVAWQKAYDVLIKAHADVVRAVPHRLRIYNDGPDLATIRGLVEELGVTDSVEFLDPSVEVIPYVARGSVFCLPSRHEGLPLALLEAVALGVPCIAADCSEGVRAALDDGRVGDLVPVDDVAAFADALRSYLLNPELLRTKAQRGPEHARSFDANVMADGWSAALTELVSHDVSPNRPADVKAP